MTDANKLIGIRPDATLHAIVNEYSAIRWFIGNTIDFMTRGDDPNYALGMYIDDEALLNPELTLNLVASLLVQYPVYGSAIVCAPDADSDGETVPPGTRLRNVVDGVATMVSNLCANAAQVGQVLTLHPDPATVPPPTILTGEDMEAFLRER